MGREVWKRGKGESDRSPVLKVSRMLAGEREREEKRSHHRAQERQKYASKLTNSSSPALSRIPSLQSLRRRRRHSPPPSFAEVFQIRHLPDVGLEVVRTGGIVQSTTGSGVDSAAEGTVLRCGRVAVPAREGEETP